MGLRFIVHSIFIIIILYCFCTQIQDSNCQSAEAENGGFERTFTLKKCGILKGKKGKGCPTPHPPRTRRTTRRTTAWRPPPKATTRPPKTTTRPPATLPPKTTHPPTLPPKTTHHPPPPSHTTHTSWITTPKTGWEKSTTPRPHGWNPPTTKGWGTGATVQAIIPKTPAKDCCEVQKQGYKKCGVYQISPTNEFKTTVYCDLAGEDGGGWTILMRREPTDGSTTNFYVNRKSYNLGFGNPATTYWLGLKTWAVLLEKRDQELKVCLENFRGGKFQGTYKHFFVDPKNDYMLSFDGFSGNMENSLQSHNNSKFHAPDHDRTDVGCAQLYRAGWWFHQECYDVLLTGKYKSEKEAVKPWSDQDSDYGITWASVTRITAPGRIESSLKYVLMKVRPRSGCGGGGSGNGMVSPGGNTGGSGGGDGGPGEAESILTEYTE